MEPPRLILIHNVEPHRLYGGYGMRRPIRSSPPLDAAACMGMDKYLLYTNCGAEIVDRRAPVPKWSHRHKANCSTEMLDHLGQLLRDGAIKAVKEADVSVA